MVSKLDKSVGAVLKALDDKEMLKNSIVVFLSDNGAPNVGYYNNWGSNYPWRGVSKIICRYTNIIEEHLVTSLLKSSCL